MRLVLHAAGLDMHQAFDTACDAYANEFGEAGLAAFELDMPIFDTLLPLDAALREAGEHGGAWPYAARSGFTRRTVRVVTSQTHTPLTPGPVSYTQLLPELAAVDPDCALQPGEVVESAECTAYRARFKPVTTRNAPPSKAQFAVLKGDFILGYFPTSAEARAYAVGFTKNDEGAEEYALSIVKVTSRQDGPLLEVARTRVAASSRIKVVFATAKPTVKVAGWVFGATQPT